MDGETPDGVGDAATADAKDDENDPGGGVGELDPIPGRSGDVGGAAGMGTVFGRSGGGGAGNDEDADGDVEDGVSDGPPCPKRGIGSVFGRENSLAPAGVGIVCEIGSRPNSPDLSPGSRVDIRCSWYQPGAPSRAQSLRPRASEPAYA